MKVKNVGEAKRLLSANGIKVTSSKYTSGNTGTIETSDNSSAQSILGGMGLLTY